MGDGALLVRELVVECWGCGGYDGAVLACQVVVAQVAVLPR